MRVAVISLRRTPERWNAFLQRNQQELENCELLRVDGIDGKELLSSNIQSRLVTQSAQECWTAGSIGVALSHLFCWRICCNSKSPIVVLEDDVILAKNLDIKLQKLINLDTKMMLLGWNLDSMLRAEFSQKQEMISLFEPPYPGEKDLREIVNSNDIRQSKRLHNCFGLPGYWLHPDTANKLLNTIKELKNLPLTLGRGFPMITTNGIDSLLNLHYQHIEAEVVMPPLALALNNPRTSLTRGTPDRFSTNKA